MLTAIQPTGAKPPFFVIHGANGVLPIGAALSKMLDPDQPFYSVHANGFDGRPRHESGAEMARDYAAEIMEVAPTGPVVIGAQCLGCLVALEVAGILMQKGRTIGPVMLMDPPLGGFGRGSGTVGPNDATLAFEALDKSVQQQLYNYTRHLLMVYANIPYFDIPYDIRDREQLHAAIMTSINAKIALTRYRPKPFLGAAEMIIVAEKAPLFFSPQCLWNRLLPNPHATYILPVSHPEMFRSRLGDTGRLVKFMLQGAFDAPKPLERQAERMFA